ncbi:enoyl-CoA hydratase/isomerase family protein [Bradyrhizobium sp. 174]|nr:enoyl-CoA hydratase/isomerase family protein [Bradyrhizobium sp. 174]
MTFRDDDELLVAIFTGAGDRTFSAGWDLKEVAEHDQAGAERRPDILPRFAELEIWKPMIAAIDGYCIGYGLEISCNWISASRHLNPASVFPNRDGT